MINIGDLTKEFILRLWDDIQLWRLRREYAKATESIKHLILDRKEIKQKIQNIESYYEVK